MERIKIKDIAQQLGVSTATVSNVIHGKTNKVSAKTIERVQKALEENQYIPSMAAILLAQNASPIIGIFINDHEKYEGHTLSDFFISSSLNALSNEIDKQNRFMMVKKTKNVQDIIQFASMWNLEGLIVIGFCQQDYSILRRQMHIPFVVYDGFCNEMDNIANIVIDNFDGGYKMGKYLNQNHSHALLLSDNDSGVDHERICGFQKGFSGNITYLQIPMVKEKRWKFYQEHIQIISKATCTFALSDYYAIDFIHFLNTQNIFVPDSMSVAGFDDTPICTMIHPSLTTIKQDNALRAKIAMEMLQKLKNHEIKDTTIQLPVSLIVRDSTK
ncbi:LacI family DNA-binding transcriptional regulator [Floccifex sp.]|uniref:LacI family DNA-binding transcriptional regulator n=1 Tax=Floccifex sp. TaxID=2815810 RepID=UPI003F0108DB